MSFCSFTLRLCLFPSCCLFRFWFSCRLSSFPRQTIEEADKTKEEVILYKKNGETRQEKWKKKERDRQKKSEERGSEEQSLRGRKHRETFFFFVVFTASFKPLQLQKKRETRTRESGRKVLRKEANHSRYSFFSVSGISWEGRKIIKIMIELRGWEAGKRKEKEREDLYSLN